MGKHGPARHVRDLDWLRARVEIDPVTACWVWRGTRNHRGYGRFNYSTDQGVRTGSAHRLALELRLGRPIQIGLSALHSCDNPPCCNGGHLREGTISDNAVDAYTRGRHVPARGELNGHAKLTDEDVDDIRAALRRGETQRSIAKRYGINQAQISRIKNGKAWI